MALQENEIRPDDLMAGQAERLANDVARLVAHKAEFIEVNCPACGAAARTHAWEKCELKYVRCDACRTVYVSPRPTPAHLDKYYAESESYAYWNKHIFPASENVRREKIFRPRAKRVADACAKFGIGTDMLLEVGGGFGTFGECIRDLNLFKRIVLVEPTPGLASTCRSKKFEVIEKPIEHVDLSVYQADVIASFEVIEHLFEPEQFLRACFPVLKPGGLLVISCPNGLGFDVAQLGPHSDVVDAEHINYFNPKSLSTLVQKCGFEVMDVSTPGQLDAELVRKKALAGHIDLSNNFLLEQILIHEWDRLGTSFQQFLSDNGLSGHMMLYARKPRS